LSQTNKKHFITQNGDFGEELFVHFAFVDGGFHEDVPVRVAVESPQFHIGFGYTKKFQTKVEQVILFILCV
jgi:hypothetical protein